MAKSTIELNFMQKNDFDLGETRFFTDTVDLPEDFSQPENMFFVGQLDLGLLARYDEDGMLPKDGYLYIYCDDFSKEKDGHIPCKLYYSEAKKITRQKVKLKLERDCLAFPMENCGIAGIKKNMEKFNEQYRWDDGSESLDFNHFFHANISKIFGYYTNCQKDEKEVLEISSKNIILLQLGDNVLADGVMTFLIKEEDLKNKKFERVVLTYSQS